MKKILVTGGNSRFAESLKKIKSNFNFIYTNKKELNILKINSLKKKIKKIKPYSVLHLAGLSRPMSLHDGDISQSINLNIIGTCNLVKVCSELNIKLIYFSTSYVYEGTKGNYKETDPVKPFNNYGLSKLAGECAVQMYKNSLILRITMTEKPFAYKKAYTNLKTNFMFHEDLVNYLPKLINKRGIINVGGKPQSVFKFARQFNKKVKAIKASRFVKLPLNQTMNINLLKKLIK